VKPSAEGSNRRDRRRRRWLRFLVPGFLLALLLYGFGPGRRLRTNQVEIRLPNLPREAEGLRIAFLSDLHLGPWVSRRQVARSVEMANARHPDLVVLGGDYITQSRRYITPCADILGRLRAPLGVYAVLGNHDHWVDAPATARALKEAGIRLLDNRGEEIGPGLYLAGIDDWGSGRPDLGQALAGAREGDSVILISHNPDAILDPRARRADLILAGHTHGGQVALIGRFVVPSQYGSRHPCGLYREGDTQIYITTGVGNGFPPLRFFCPPEVTLITLGHSSPD
jgi:predicted MPP superfamily phosphohydrolase